MRLQDIMSEDVKTVTPGASVTEARSLMRANGIHHLLVIERKQVVGVVSERDLGGRLGGRGAEAAGTQVAQVMSPHVVSGSPSTTVRQAANLMRGRAVGCLAVLDGGKAVGIVTTTDLLELIGRGAERPIERSTRWTLRGRGERRATPTARHARRG